MSERRSISTNEFIPLFAYFLRTVDIRRMMFLYNLMLYARVAPDGKVFRIMIECFINAMHPLNPAANLRWLKDITKCMIRMGILNKDVIAIRAVSTHPSNSLSFGNCKNQLAILKLLMKGYAEAGALKETQRLFDVLSATSKSDPSVYCHMITAFCKSYETMKFTKAGVTRNKLNHEVLKVFQLFKREMHKAGTIPSLPYVQTMRVLSLLPHTCEVINQINSFSNQNLVEIVYREMIESKLDACWSSMIYRIRAAASISPSIHSISRDTLLYSILDESVALICASANALNEERFVQVNYDQDDLIVEEQVAQEQDCRTNFHQACLHLCELHFTAMKIFAKHGNFRKVQTLHARLNASLTKFLVNRLHHKVSMHSSTAVSNSYSLFPIVWHCAKQVTVDVRDNPVLADASISISFESDPTASTQSSSNRPLFLSLLDDVSGIAILRELKRNDLKAVSLLLESLLQAGEYQRCLEITSGLLRWEFQGIKSSQSSTQITLMNYLRTLSPKMFVAFYPQWLQIFQAVISACSNIISLTPDLSAERSKTLMLIVSDVERCLNLHHMSPFAELIEYRSSDLLPKISAAMFQAAPNFDHGIWPVLLDWNIRIANWKQAVNLVRKMHLETEIFSTYCNQSESTIQPVENKEDYISLVLQSPVSITPLVPYPTITTVMNFLNALVQSNRHNISGAKLSETAEIAVVGLLNLMKSRSIVEDQKSVTNLSHAEYRLWNQVLQLLS
jgi:hypothetical protein